jgi:AAA domain-containing protein/DnaB helicase-like protein
MRAPDPFIAPRLPQHEDAEHCVLGTLLMHPELFPSLVGKLESADFADHNRRQVFCKMLELGTSDAVLVTGALRQIDRMDLVAYASTVMEGASAPRQIWVYIKVLKEKSIERLRIHLAENIAACGYDGDGVGMMGGIRHLSEVADYVPFGEEVKVMSAMELLKKSVEPREYLLEPVMTTRSMVEIFSWRGVGKTFFALSLAGAVSSGGTFLGWKAPTARKVLFIDGELDEHSLQQRLRLLRIRNENFRVLCCDAQQNPFPHLASPLAQRIIEDNLCGADLLILDNLSALAPSTNDREAEDWIVIQSWLKELKRKYGTTTSFLHHAGHSGTSRGTTRREDLLDVVIELKRPREYKASENLRMELVFGKTRGKLSQFAEPLECWLTSDLEGGLVWGHRELEDARASQVMKLKSRGLSERKIAEETGIPRSTVQRVWEKAKSRNKS